MQHIKYQPMGQAYELMMNPLLQPLSFSLLEKHLATLSPHEFEGPKARDALFPIEAWQHEKFETPYPGFVSEGDVTVSSAHGNPIGAMHGGAQVMSSPEELDRFGLCKSNLMVRR